MSNPYGATWYSQDSILVGQGPKGIIRVPAGGGKPETVIPAKENEVLQTPQVLPGGDEILFTVAGATGDDRWDKAQIVVQSLKTGERKTLFTGGSDARYVSTGHIVYALGGNLFAYAFDAPKLKVTNGPIPILQGVLRSPARNTAATFFSFSNNGYLAYVPGSSLSSSDTLLALIDRAGTKKPLPLMPGNHSAPRISPDGKQAAIQVDDGKEVYIGIYNLSGTQAMRRLTFGGGTAERLTTPEKGVLQIADSASRTENVITVSDSSGAIWALSLDDRKLKPIISKPPRGGVGLSVFSPDGHWLAYQSTSQTPQIYVQPFPPTGSQYNIPQTGTFPLWSPDGKQIFYLSGGGGVRARINSVEVRTQPSVEFGKPVSLPIQNDRRSAERPYDILPNGSQFIVMLEPEEAQSGDQPPSQINTVQNWFSELKKQVPVKYPSFS